jgi:hypothetical protein
MVITRKLPPTRHSKSFLCYGLFKTGVVRKIEELSANLKKREVIFFYSFFAGLARYLENVSRSIIG